MGSAAKARKTAKTPARARRRSPPLTAPPPVPPPPPPPPLTIMVSSTVYGQEQLLDQIYATLDGFGYTVWMSHAGTLPHQLGRHNFEICLRAVAECDIYFGIISPLYGSGREEAGGQSITHTELLRAIELDRPRYLLAHEKVAMVRRVLMDLGYEDATKRSTLKFVKRGAVIDDLRLIDMYEAATREGIPVGDRKDHWVQQYRTDAEVLRYVSVQFGNQQQVRKMLEDKDDR